MACENSGISPFGRLLSKISKELSSDDVGTMKAILQLDEHLPVRELEDANRGLNIFLLLKKAGKLGPDNLSLLKDLVKECDNVKLLKKIEDYEHSNAGLQMTAETPLPVSHSLPEMPGQTEDHQVIRPSGLRLSLDDTTICNNSNSCLSRREDRDIAPTTRERSAPETELVRRRLSCSSLGPTMSVSSVMRPDASDARNGISAAPDSDFQLPTSSTSENTLVKRRTSSPPLPAATMTTSTPERRATTMMTSTVASNGSLPPASVSVSETPPVDLISSSPPLMSIAACRVSYEPYESLDVDGIESPSDLRSSYFQEAPTTTSGRSTSSAIPVNSVRRWDAPAVALRGYQLELAEPSSDGGLNSIICAPTGSGKTLTAGYVVRQRMTLAEADGREFRCLFVVCQRTLVLQQKKALEEFLGADAAVGAVDEDDLLRSVIHLPFKVIVLTAQKLVNALESRHLCLDDFQMLVMDECHHADLNHPFNAIMRAYHAAKRDAIERRREPRLPMIVGLTASLGAGSGSGKDASSDLSLSAAQRHYVRICANLDCACITHVRRPENRAELLAHNPKPSADQIVAVAARPPDSPFYAIASALMERIETESRLVQSRTHRRGTQAYENWIVDCKTKAACDATAASPEAVFAAETLEKLNAAWMLHDQLRIKDAKQFLDSYFGCAGLLPAVPSETQRAIVDSYARAAKELDVLVERETVEDCPQLWQLSKLLTTLYRNHSDPRGIILTRTRQAVNGLFGFINEQTEFHRLVFPAKFVGQGGKEGTMTQTEQENTLRRFRLGSEDLSRLNLLVATDIAQEGLDLPKCNFVIRYEFVSNEIGSVQSRGRARAPNSELYLIVTKGSINETRELENLQREHRMQEALHAIDRVPQEELRRAIERQQEDNWVAYQQELEKSRTRSNTVDFNDVTIRCSKCKVFLCDAKDMRSRGSNYICISDDFERRIIFREIADDPKKKTNFISEVHLGQIFCGVPSCPNKLGLKIRYKKGHRPNGFVLGKEGCVWKTADMNSYSPVKQWSKVPFLIEKENF